MKFWNEIEKDAFSYYMWFCKDEASEILGTVPVLSVFSINGAMINGVENRSTFLEICSKEIKKVFLEDILMSGFKLYLIGNVEVKDKTSRIERYKKVWKSLHLERQLDGFNKGPEIEMHINEKLYFSSVAEFSLENLVTALEITARYSKRFTIIASQRSDLLTKNFIEDIFTKTFNYNDYKFATIDYFRLALYLCLKGDIVFRWGDSIEEAEIAMIFEENIVDVFLKLNEKKDLPEEESYQKQNY